MTDRRRCATCRWWDGDSSWEVESLLGMERRRANDARKAHDCPEMRTCVLHGDAELDDRGSRVAFVSLNLNSIETVMLTPPDFGCAQWQAKE